MRGENADGMTSFAPVDEGQMPCVTVPKCVCLAGSSSGLAGLQVVAARPVRRLEGLGRQQLAGLAIEDVDETGAPRMDDQLARPAAVVHVDEHVLHDLVVVPRVVRGRPGRPSAPRRCRRRARRSTTTTCCRPAADPDSRRRDCRCRRRTGCVSGSYEIQPQTVDPPSFHCSDGHEVTPRSLP